MSITIAACWFTAQSGRAEIVGGALEGIEGHVFVGRFFVDDDRTSVWKVDSLLRVGFDAPGTIELEDGRIEAPLLGVSLHGRIEGTGTLQTSNRLLQEGGFIAPRLSPGTLIIDGDCEQTGGVLEIEFAGLGAGQFDTLIVTGDATLGGTLEIHFLDGYAPKAGDVLAFLQVDGQLTGSFASIVFPNLLLGFQFASSFSEGVFSLTALNDAQLVPEPTSWLLLVFGVLLLALRGRRFLEM